MRQQLWGSGAFTAYIQSFANDAWVVALLCVGLSCFLSSDAYAQNDGGESDVRLVIDISGSMKSNDPANLREPAVGLLMELLPDGSHAGVWTFGKEVNMLVPFGKVNDNWREKAKQKAGDINSVGLFTNIGSALEKATEIGKKSKDKAHLILLTDGMVDIDKDPEVNAKEWRRIVDEVLPKIREAGFSVHTVALSDNADTDLMKRLSLETDGHAGVAKTADDLMPAFLKAFDAAAPSQQLPLAGNHFVVDSSVEEFTALMFRDDPADDIVLVGPDNIEIKEGDLNRDVSWHHTANYDLVTITRPLEGQWVVKGPLADGSRITVVSDLNLRVKPLPINAPVGSELDLQLALQEDKAIVTRKDFLNLLTISAVAKPKGGKAPVWQHQFNTQQPPKKGIFSTVVSGFIQPGEYSVRVELDGKSFQRTFAHDLVIAAPFEASLDKSHNANSQMEYLLTVAKNAQNISVKDTQIAVAIYTPDRRKQVQPLKLNEMDQWQYRFAPTMEGKHYMEVMISGMDKQGNEFEYLLDNLKFNYTPGADFDSLFAEPEPKEEPEPEAEPEPKEEPEPVASSAAASSEIAEEGEAPEKSTGLPSWAIYAALGVGNLLLVGLGIFAFKKIMGETQDAAEGPPEEPAPEPEPFEPSEAMEAMEGLEDTGVMQMDEIEDEIPPMEDLAPDLDFDEDEETPVEPEPAEEEPEAERIDEDFEFDLSALDDSPEDGMPMEPTSTQPESTLSEPELIADDADARVAGEQEAPGAPDDEVKEEEDLAQAMLKAQGLDLAEDELDDAISNLIDELDDGSDSSTVDNSMGEINLDDFDFDDEDDAK